MRIKVKCPYPLAKANPTDAGYDLRSTVSMILPSGEVHMVPTGCFLHMEEGDGILNMLSEAQVRGRSSLALKGIFTHLGTIDQDFHSEIKVIMINLGKEPYVIKEGDKIAQIVPGLLWPTQIVEVSTMEEKRGGFGSSGV